MRKGSKVRRSMSMIMLAVALAIVSICGNVTTSDALKMATKKHPWRLAKKMTVRIGSDWKTQSYSLYEKFDDFNHDGEEDVESLENLKIKILTPKSKWKKKIKVKTGSFSVYSKGTGRKTIAGYGSDGAISVKGLKKGTVTLKLKCTGRFVKTLGYDTDDKSKKKTIKGKKISFTTKVKITVKAAKKKTTKKKTTETEETEATPTPETPAPEEEEVDYGETPAPTDAN